MRRCLPSIIPSFRTLSDYTFQARCARRSRSCMPAILPGRAEHNASRMFGGSAATAQKELHCLNAAALLCSVRCAGRGCAQQHVLWLVYSSSGCEPSPCTAGLSPSAAFCNAVRCFAVRLGTRAVLCGLAHVLCCAAVRQARAGLGRHRCPHTHPITSPVKQGYTVGRILATCILISTGARGTAALAFVGTLLLASGARAAPKHRTHIWSGGAWLAPPGWPPACGGAHNVPPLALWLPPARSQRPRAPLRRSSPLGAEPRPAPEGAAPVQAGHCSAGSSEFGPAPNPWCAAAQLAWLVKGGPLAMCTACI